MSYVCSKGEIKQVEIVRPIRGVTFGEILIRDIMAKKRIWIVEYLKAEPTNNENQRV